MKKYILAFVFALLGPMDLVLGQVNFTHRVEVATEWVDNNFIILPSENGTVAFRSVSSKGFNISKKLQYFTTDRHLKASKLMEFPLKDHFDLIGFDLDGGWLYLLLQKGDAYSGDKLIYGINLETQQLIEVEAENILDMEIREFLVMDEKAILMGMMEYRPAIQVFDLKNKNVYTVQGIYSNEVNILQIRKDPELKFFDVLVNRRDRFKRKTVSVLTFDERGNKLREVKIEPRKDPQLEIEEGLLTPVQDYIQALIGPFGLRKREPNKGIYFSRINEFGEYKNRFYTLTDFENFYNYLPEKQKARRERSLEKAIRKEKSITIPNSLVTREVISKGGNFLVYNDYFMASTSRFRQRDVIYHNDFYRYYPDGFRNQVNLGGYTWYNSRSREGVNYQYKYLAAQFLLLDQQGNMIWDNTLSLQDLITANPGKFGEVSFDGDNLFYMYLEEDKLNLTHLFGGEVKFENQEFELELLAKNERIKETQVESLSLMWWYDHYFLLSGKQQIRFQGEDARERVREVFFITKIKVDGQLDRALTQEEN
ncbi:transcriptional regulator [Echinicola jeungdonensis]|uniref:Transcriptional regulator n=1 Tax=Echinicola jeungdonensis TaxID=709343 RepID=A0ABV5J8W6_9BACT|nr:transcriptional regulator [Echinicola jeungdonensis]MDN3670008.1 transcriptional regulator [Echinicola jeungdonensis]